MHDNFINSVYHISTLTRPSWTVNDDDEQTLKKKKKKDGVSYQSPKVDVCSSDDIEHTWNTYLLNARHFTTGTSRCDWGRDSYVL